MAESFFFYDLETSGFNPRAARIMQFAGQRTSLDLVPMGEPVNILIKMAEDVLPDPQAILVTGITPQKTLKEGITEADFLKIFTEKVATPDTIFVGFNTVRFDDEFVRFLHYRNFYDPYEWQWQDGRSRWDLLDLVRMTRALRPDGIKWPVDTEGRPTNRLELLAAENKLDHTSAHDALSDVQATIAVAKLIYDKQPKLFTFLLKLRDKNQIAKFVQGTDPFIYTSGKYPSEFEKTTIVSKLVDHPERPAVLVYDLRHDPTPFAELSAKGLAEAWRFKPGNDKPRLPIKTLQFNRCPAVAPLSTLDDASQKRLRVDIETIKSNQAKLAEIKNWPARVLEALKLLDTAQTKRYAKHAPDVDGQLYNGFFDSADKRTMATVRQSTPSALTKLMPQFKDDRLITLWPLYQARNFPETLSADERNSWEQHRAEKLLTGDENSRFAIFEDQIQDLAVSGTLNDHQEKILEALQSYGKTIRPVTDDALQ
ncbi:MAG TPA: exodeoxyribonuclease I [Candidatus Saccharimonadales bacterium]|nr:exodeoxyribonuclease I [Candidatus Saccharimonadales bacterium]